MYNDLSTIGMKFGYGYETTAGTMPSSFIGIPKVKSTPEFNPEVNAGETTSLNNEEYTSYIPLLKDIGGSVGFGIAMTQDTLTAWNTMCDTAESNLALGKATWFTVWHPELNQAVFFKGIPSKIAMPAAEVNSVWDTTVYVTITNEPEMKTAIEPSNPASA